jgi:hypothetical protein
MQAFDGMTRRFPLPPACGDARLEVRSLRTTLAATAAAIALAIAAPAAHAQQQPGPWKQTVFLYGMGAAIDGNATIGNLTVPVDVSISDMFDALKMGAMAAYRVENEEWSFEGDLTYMNLGWRASGSRGLAGASVDVDQLTLMGTVGRRINRNLEALFSLTYFDLSSELKVGILQQSRSASRDASWVDPMVGLQYVMPIGAGKWSYSLRADYGGFGVGSNQTWHVLTAFRRQNTERFGWFVGYRVLSYDYEDGSGSGFQRYDLTQQGPMAGINISF